ncbi:unnamed protein product [Closterium sp. Yama58-4]|nr:unnamed protein product [Closterium sp. Yama58-4]
MEVAVGRLIARPVFFSGDVLEVQSSSRLDRCVAPDPSARPPRRLALQTSANAPSTARRNARRSAGQTSEEGRFGGSRGSRGRWVARSSLAEHHGTDAAAARTQEADVAGSSGADAAAVEDAAAAAAAVVDLSDVMEWELDFCSRPLLDERGKRVWELLVCDSSRRLQFAEYFPSNRINSATLKDALLRVMDATGAPKPQKIRFFRAQMATIISKAATDLDIQPVPSQRCVTLLRWLDERYDAVYRVQPNFQANAPPLLQLEAAAPQDLPDTLRGEQWAFVQLPLSGILEEMQRVRAGDMFGSVLDLAAMGLASLPPDSMVPGVAVASTRATPLAAWTSALELASLRVDPSKACLLLATGVADTWRYAFYRRSMAADAEARAWEEAKRACGGLHFLAVQRDLEEEDCTGFWLLQDADPPRF